MSGWRGGVWLGAWLGVWVSGCGPGGKVTGSVDVHGGVSSRATVTLIGSVTQRMRVSDDGSYLFQNVPNGLFRVEAEAPSTLEGKVSAAVSVENAAGTAPPLLLTAVGEVSGRVTSPTVLTGATVSVRGQAVRSPVGADGSFLLQGVKAGSQTLVAEQSDYQPATLEVVVTYGARLDNQLLALQEPAHGTGRIEGRALLFDQSQHAGIAVRIEGTSLQATTDATGAYALTAVPTGALNLVFTAAGYGAGRLEKLSVAPGATLKVRDVRLYFAQNRFLGQVYQGKVYLSPDSATALFVGSSAADPSSSWLYALGLTDARAPRPLLRLTQPSLLNVAWQADSQKAAIQPVTASPEKLWAVDVVSGKVDEITNLLFNDEHSDFAVDHGRVIFLTRTPAPYPALGVYDFKGPARSLEQVGIHPAASSCRVSGWWPGTWPRALRYFQLSSRGEVAYQVPGDGLSGWEVHAYSGADPSRLGAGAACLSYSADGMTLVGARFGTALELVALSGASSTQLLLSGPIGGFRAGFTGDRQSVWLHDASSILQLLIASPVAGGPGLPLFISLAGFTVSPQPGGDQLAIHHRLDNTLTLKTPNNRTLRVYSTTPAATAAVGFFSPGGKRFVFGFAPDLALQVSATATHAPVTLPGGVLTFDAAALSRAMAFSPQESVVAWMGKDLQEQVARPGDKVLDASPGGSTDAHSWIDYSPNDQSALVRDADTDKLLKLGSGTLWPLAKRAQPVSVGAPLWLGDGSRALFQESPSAPSRVLVMDPESGAVRYIADNDGSALLPVPGGRQVLLVEDPSGLPDPASAVLPAGLYVISPPA